MSNLQGLGTGLSKAALLFEPYERQARLYPAFLCILPLVVMAITLYGNQLLDMKGIFALAGGAGLMYLLADIVRSKGKERRKLSGRNGAAPLASRSYVTEMVS